MKFLPFVRNFLLAAALTAIPAFAINRSIVINAPPTAKPGGDVHVSITASTDAADAEQIGFFHAEFSTDDGKTWQTRYAEKAGRVATRAIDLKAGPEGSKVLIRVRIAFRGGKAGDVDFTGAPIKWGDSWGKWEAPPAKQTTINVGK